MSTHFDIDKYLCNEYDIEIIKFLLALQNTLILSCYILFEYVIWITNLGHNIPEYNKQNNKT